MPWARPSCSKAMFQSAVAVFVCLVFFENGISAQHPEWTGQTNKNRLDISQRPCPCENADLCKFISKIPEKQVYGFAVNSSKEVYLKYDWSKLTTLAMWDFTDELMCFAHSKGVRLDLVVSHIPKENLTNKEWRKQFVQEKVDLIQNQFLDGFNFDPEYGVGLHSGERQAMVDMVREIKTALVKINPNAKVSFDAAWASFCVDERCYDYKGISEAADWLFIMSYDIQGQIWTPHCIATTNTPFTRMVDGIHGYLALDIDPSKLVLGLPWYGYDYPCMNLTDDGVCMIPRGEYHGSPCSDWVGNQKALDEIFVLMENTTTGRKWNINGESPQFDYRNATGGIRQVHYDDPESLLHRYRFAVLKDLRGVGFWHVGCMTNMDAPERSLVRKKMWDLIPNEASWKSYLNDHTTV